MPQLKHWFPRNILLFLDNVKRCLVKRDKHKLTVALPVRISDKKQHHERAFKGVMKPKVGFLSFFYRRKKLCFVRILHEVRVDYF